MDTTPLDATPLDTASLDTASLDTASLDTASTPADGTGPETTTPPGYSDRKGAHLKRLRRIEGQARGLQRMIEEDKYCIDVLTQVSAMTKALEAVALSLLDEHLRHCVVHAAAQGGSEAETKINEASAAIARLVRS